MYIVCVHIICMLYLRSTVTLTGSEYIVNTLPGAPVLLAIHTYSPSSLHNVTINVTINVANNLIALPKL